MDPQSRRKSKLLTGNYNKNILLTRNLKLITSALKKYKVDAG
jgi:hypothetical protein